MEKKILITSLFMAAASILITSCAFGKIKINLNGSVETKEFLFDEEISGVQFSNLDTTKETEFICNVRESNENKMVVNAPNNFYKYLNVKNEKYLKIFGNFHNIYLSKTPITIDIYSDSFSSAVVENYKKFFTFGDCFSDQFEITMSGNIQANIESFVGSKFNIRASGNSSLNINELSADSLLINSSGNSEIIGKGKCSSSNIKTTGNTCINMEELESENVEINSTGNSTIRVNFSNSLKLDASGSSKIYYTGSGNNIDFKSSGAAELIRI